MAAPVDQSGPAPEPFVDRIRSCAEALANAARAAGPPLVFGLRLWGSVCLALYVAFWLELDNAYWAGTSAALMCQPHLGASMRKGWFRMIGTLVGAVALTLRDLRRVAAQPVKRPRAVWEGRMYRRLTTLPDQAAPLQRAQLETQPGTPPTSARSTPNKDWGPRELLGGARKRAASPWQLPN
jgi:Fusaric acid resistance protein family